MHFPSITIALLAIGLPLFFNACQRDSEETSFDGRRISKVDIRFDGGRHVGEARLRNFIKSSPDHPYSTETVDEDIKSLYASGLVDNVRVLAEATEAGLVLVYEIKPRPAFGPGPGFIGNQAVSDSRLTKESQIPIGKPVTETDARLACKSLEAFYATQGFTEAKVTYRLERGGEYHDDFFLFIVEEGQKGGK